MLKRIQSVIGQKIALFFSMSKRHICSAEKSRIYWCFIFQVLFLKTLPCKAQLWLCAVCFLAVVDDYGIVFDASSKEYHYGDVRMSRLRSPDVPLACPLVADDLPHVFPAPLQPLTGPITGFAFNIYNNVWDTNYIMWYPYDNADASFRARFYVDI